VMNVLFLPMFYTSITSAAGFASLALTPIPPVQVFGIFVSIGVILAWIFTITFVPAYIMFIPHTSFKNFGSHHVQDEKPSLMARILNSTGKMVFGWAKLILIVTCMVVIIAIWGISRIQINDNPTKWFAQSHPIRVADQVLNDHFGGTYMAYLVLEPQEVQEDIHGFRKELIDRLSSHSSELRKDYPLAPSVFNEVIDYLKKNQQEFSSSEDLVHHLSQFASDKIESHEHEAAYTWEEVSLFLDEQKQSSQIFKNPHILSYISGLQKALLHTGIVGKSNSLTDIVKTVHRELFRGQDNEYRIPDSSQAVAQCLLTYQNSHRPHDLWHFVTPDYRKTSLWIQLKSGDNKDMEKVVKAVKEYVQNNPPPVPLTHNWFGLTYINVVWQNKMVKGMLMAFMGSFLIVFLMTTILYRSVLWGGLAMIPLTVTIGFIYGTVGIVGKDYDMPVAVLSSLSLGLAIDFAIHFLSRSKSMYLEHNSWAETSESIFGEPARAITRNVMVITIGFLPLLAATLVPYKTVGIFLASIMVISGVGTLIILPSLIKIFASRLFPLGKVMGPTCNCVLCIATSATVAA
ncbi:MAG: MMPL family transporter, partial [Thermodesulfobacteriota bacterium]|nr:MMPL family transporter [Thermodesulfobacteriota bacterium]